MAPKKPQAATLEDVVQLNKEFSAGLDNRANALTQALKESEQRVQGAVDTLASRFAEYSKDTDRAISRTADDAKVYTRDSIETQDKKFGGRVQGVDDSVKALEQNLQGVVAQEGRAKSELRTACASLRDEVINLRSWCQEQMHSLHSHLTEAQTEQRRQIDAEIANVRREATEGEKKMMALMDQRLTELREALLKEDQAQDELNRKIHDDIFAKLSEQQNAHNTGMLKTAADLQEAERAVYERFTTWGGEVDTKLDHLHKEADKAQVGLAEVSNIPTRRVDWVIPRVSELLQGSAGSQSELDRRWFSPKFDMAGAHSLQLEVRSFRRAIGSTVPRHPALPPSDEDVGDVALFLWACKGATLSFRLLIGGKTQTLEKTFDGLNPHGTKRMGFIGNFINRRDDTLTVSIELLEMSCEIEHRIEPAGACLAPIDDPAKQPIGGNLVYHRKVAQSLYDQVQNVVEHVRSRAVRKIEWRVENASRLLACFPHGKPICSAPFDAFGIESMQLLFYPAGYTGATEGFASLFLYCPAGTTVHCYLSLGNVRREVKYTYEEGCAYGRTNHSSFKKVVDDITDTVLCCLEIVTAHQDLRANVAHSSPSQQATKLPASVVPAPQQTEHSMSLLFDSVSTMGVTQGPATLGSVVKVKRQEGNEEIRTLPSLWAIPANGLEASQLPDGALRSFDELRNTASSFAFGRTGSSIGMLKTFGRQQLGEPFPTDLRRSGSTPTLKSLPRLHEVGGVERKNRPSPPPAPMAGTA